MILKAMHKIWIILIFKSNYYISYVITDIKSHFSISMDYNKGRKSYNFVNCLV